MAAVTQNTGRSQPTKGIRSFFSHLIRLFSRLQSSQANNEVHRLRNKTRIRMYADCAIKQRCAW